MDSSVPNGKDNKKSESPLKILLRGLKLRHLVFLLVAVIGLAITAMVIIVLLRISTFRITEASPESQISGNDYLGIIGVLVALAAAFIGALATIMFGNSVYTAYISKQAEKKIDRHEKYIPDLYVMGLRIEANECEREGDILRAIERRIGVVHFALKASYSTNLPTIDDFVQTLANTAESLNNQNLIDHYCRPGVENKKIIRLIEYHRQEIHRRIKNVIRLDRAFLVDDKMRMIMGDIDRKIKEFRLQLDPAEGQDHAQVR